MELEEFQLDSCCGGSNRFSICTIFIGFLYTLLIYHFLGDVFPFNPSFFILGLILF